MCWKWVETNLSITLIHPLRISTLILHVYMAEIKKNRSNVRDCERERNKQIDRFSWIFCSNPIIYQNHIQVIDGKYDSALKYESEYINNQ